MNKQRICKCLLAPTVILVSILLLLGRADATAEAASRANVRKITSVNSLTGSGTIKLAKGKQAVLKTTVTVMPNRAENRKVNYKSSDKSVATVTNRGVITGRKPGRAKITVTSVKDKKRKATVKVTVLKGTVTYLGFDRHTVPPGELKKGDTIKLKPDIKISAGGSKDVVWKTSDKKVAKVDKNGTVTAVGNGDAYISVTAADGSGKASYFLVRVKAYKLKYSYEVKFLNQPYNDFSAIMYVKTNNPSCDNFVVSLYNMDGRTEVSTVDTSCSYADLKDLDNTSENTYSFYKTDGGYLGIRQFEDPGKYKVRVEEIASTDDYSYSLKGYANQGYIDVKNYEKEEKAWMESVLNKVTTSSMSKKEKMEAITKYMYDHSVYYKKSSTDGQTVWLAAELGVPFWKFSKYEFDSYDSPAILTRWGRLINYPLKSLYYKYKRGTPEWVKYHMCAQSVEDGSYYSFCHTSDSNIVDVSKIKQIDLSTWKFYECYK